MKTDTQLKFTTVEQMCHFVKQIQEEYTEFKSEEDNAILFGRTIEMADIRNSNCAMRVVPVTKDEFKMVQNPYFVAFLATFCVQRNQAQPRGFLQVSNKINTDEFKRVVDQLVGTWLKKVQDRTDEEGTVAPISKETVAAEE